MGGIFNKTRSLRLLFVLIALGGNALAQQDPADVIERSVAALGGAANAGKVNSIRASANCTGPRGPYTTDILSARDGRLIFSQKKKSGDEYIGQADDNGGWTRTGDTLTPADKRAVFAWRSHDFQSIALDLRRYFARFEPAGEGDLAGKPAAVLRAVDELGSPAELFFDKASGLLIGFKIRNPFASDPETIQNVFTNWKQVGELLLPSRIVVTDKQGDFVLDFHAISINDLKPNELSLPGRTKTPTTTNMALIPGAAFDMGQTEADVPGLQERFKIKRAEVFAGETPKHRVTVGSFYIDRTEVTNVQFKIFVEQHPEWQKNKIAAALHNGKYLHHWNAKDFPAGQANYPAVFVSWYAASAYCQDQGKRLPTEAEWEFAARGGLEGKAFPWGDEMPNKTLANYAASGINGPAAVGSFPANGYGLFDMAGNVWEFLADEWRSYAAAPPSGIAAANSASSQGYLQVRTRRALRGGSYGGAPVNLRVTYRDNHSPENAVEHVGFRCAMTNPTQSAAVDELLKRHHAARAAHFTRDARSMVAEFSDDFLSVANGKISRPERRANLDRFQNYLNSSTFIEWDDITPPVVRMSDDGTMGYIIVHKKVRLKQKQVNGTELEETEIFAWLSLYRRINGEWKLVTVVSTNTPEND